ncbi:MAG: RsiV family protein [Sporolactobacillus sp.]
MRKIIDELKQNYVAITVPESLELRVNDVLAKVRKTERLKKHMFRFAAVAAAILLFIVTINVSPGFAKTVSKIPLLGNFVRIVTLKTYQSPSGTQSATIKVAHVNLKNKQLAGSLNRKYIREGEELYKQFQKDTRAMNQHGEKKGYLGIESGVIIAHDDARLLSIGRYVVITVGSSSTTLHYDTVDKKRGILITLPSLFKDNRYITIISQNIRTQMQQQMKTDKTKMYFIGKATKQTPFDGFIAIKAKQDFYINKQNKLVIVFNKYDVAPGYMGEVMFTIPTSILRGQLVSSQYIK